MRWYLFGFFALFAWAPYAKALTLEQAVGRAEKGHPDFRVLEAEVAAAEGNKLSAGSLPNPDLAVGPGFKTTSEGGSNKFRFHGELEISQLLEFPGKRSLRVFLAEGSVRLRRIALEGFRMQLLIEVRRAFFQAQMSRQLVELRSEQVQSAQIFLKSARKRLESGYGSDFEAMKAQADLIAARKDLGEALADVRSAKLKLAGLMGSPADTAFEIEGKFDEAVFPSQTTDPLAQALRSNSGMKAGLLKLGLAEKNMYAAKLNRNPDLILSPSLEYARDEQVYGLKFSLPLPVWSRGNGDIQTANAEARKAGADLEKLKQEISLAVTAARDKIRLSGEQLALYSPEFLDGLKDIMARAEKVYGKSAVSLLMYLEARRAYFDGLADYYQTLGEWAENNLELESAMGIPAEIEIHHDGEQKP